MTKQCRKELLKVLCIFCEGNTEYNYIDGYRKKYKYPFKIKPVDVSGGGYKKMLDVVKKTSSSGMLARFILLDFDRYLTIASEKTVFNNLIQYISSQNAKSLPLFLVISSPDFDDFVLLHDAKYNMTNKPKILASHSYASINDLKADDKIFDVFNSKPCSQSNAISRLNPNKIVTNNYNVVKKSFRITNKVVFNSGNSAVKTSNIDEFFKFVCSIS